MTDSLNTPNADPTSEPRPQRSEVLTNVLVLVALAIGAILFWSHVRTIVLFVFTLGLLVAVHEWGHFIAAKAVGVTVYEFALGFGPKLVTYMRRSGTEYTIRAFPIGGFVNPKGMQPDDPITPDGLNGRRPAERALVYLAGPLMNIILGVAVLMLSGWLVGTPDPSKALVGEVPKGKEAARMPVISVNGMPAANIGVGLRVGDQILAINGEPVTWETVTQHVHPNANKPVIVKVLRKGDTLELRGTPQRAKIEDPFVTITDVPAGSKLEIRKGDQLAAIGADLAQTVADAVPGTPVEDQPPSPRDKPLWTDRQSVDEARRILKEKAGQPVMLSIWRNSDTYMELKGVAAELPLDVRPGERWVGQLGFSPLPGMGARVGLAQSLDSGQRYVVSFFTQIGAIFRSTKLMNKSVGGPIKIFDQIQMLDSMPPLYFFHMLASLSLSLAVFNLLPVPILDGGHMLLLTVEVLRRRRLEPETQRAVQMVGLALIGVLFVYITWKDLFEKFL